MLLQFLNHVMARLSSERGEVNLNDKKPDVINNPDGSITTSADEAFAKQFEAGEFGDAETEPKDEKPEETEVSEDKPEGKPEETEVKKTELSDEEVLGFLKGKGYEGETVDNLIEDAKGKKTYQRKYQEQASLAAALAKDPRYEELVKEIVLKSLTGGATAAAAKKPPAGFEKLSEAQVEQLREQAKFLVGEPEKKETLDREQFKRELMTEIEEKNEYNRFIGDFGKDITPRRKQIMQMVANTHGVSNVSYQTLKFLLDTAKALELEAIENKKPIADNKDKPIGSPPAGDRPEKTVTDLDSAKTDEDFGKIFNKLAKKKGWLS